MVTTVSMQIAIVSIRFLPGFHSFHAWAAIFDGHLYPPWKNQVRHPHPPSKVGWAGWASPCHPTLEWEGVVERALPFSTGVADEALYNRFQRNPIQKEYHLFIAKLEQSYVNACLFCKNNNSGDNVWKPWKLQDKSVETIVKHVASVATINKD